MTAKPKSMRLARFQDPAAEVVWAGLMTLDVALQYQVLRELASDLAFEASEPKTAVQRIKASIAALHECYDILGRSPSVSEYRRLREELPELKLLAESNIRKWLGGGWNDCLSRALLPTESDGDFVAVPLEQDFTRDELLTFLRLCATELNARPRLADYSAWVRRPDVADRYPRRPMSATAFARFGGFLKMQVEAGVINEEQARRGVNGRILPSTHRYEDEELLAALREVAERLRPRIGNRSPRLAEYKQERQKIIDESERTKKLRTIPTPAAVLRRFGSWDDALVAAGLTPLGGMKINSNRRARRPSYDREAIREALCRAWAEHGHPFTADTYTAWRKAQIAAAQGEGQILHLPHKETAVKMFKGWPEACIACIPGYVPANSGFGRSE